MYFLRCFIIFRKSQLTHGNKIMWSCLRMFTKHLGDLGSLWTTCGRFNRLMNRLFSHFFRVGRWSLVPYRFWWRPSANIYMKCVWVTVCTVYVFELLELQKNLRTPFPSKSITTPMVLKCSGCPVHPGISTLPPACFHLIHLGVYVRII